MVAPFMFTLCIHSPKVSPIAVRRGAPLLVISLFLYICDRTRSDTVVTLLYNSSGLGAIFFSTFRLCYEQIEHYCQRRSKYRRSGGHNGLGALKFLLTSLTTSLTTTFLSEFEILISICWYSFFSNNLSPFDP